jgi:NADPH:quinone reductase-like Zn-dependent oxidoreductase
MAPELPATMSAWQYTSASPNIESNFVLKHDLPLPAVPKSGDKSDPAALIQVLAVALNPADYKVPEIPFFGKLALGAPPQVPGQDLVGRVVSSTTPGLAEGDLVVGSPIQGALAEYVRVPANTKGALVKVPAALANDAQGSEKLAKLAGLGTAGLNALNALDSLPKGGRVVIVGASGGVGHIAVQIAKAQGASRVVGISSGRNAEFVKSLGADEVVDYTAVKEPRVALADLTKGNGREKFDLVLDNVASPGLNLYFHAHDYLKEGGKYKLIGGGMTAGAVSVVLKAFLLPGFLGGGRRKFEFFYQPPTNKDFDKLLSLAAEGKVKTEIDQLYPREEAVAAFKKVRSGHARGKVCISMTT